VSAASPRETVAQAEVLQSSLHSRAASIAASDGLVRLSILEPVLENLVDLVNGPEEEDEGRGEGRRWSHSS
jgi:hypothetical protein